VALERTAITGIYPTLGVSADATLIEDSIGILAVCADCIIRITGLPSSRLNDALPRLIGALRVASILAACGSCLRQRVVHRREPVDDEVRPSSRARATLRRRHGIRDFERRVFTGA
jgi:hypothetical protein